MQRSQCTCSASCQVQLTEQRKHPGWLLANSLGCILTGAPGGMQCLAAMHTTLTPHLPRSKGERTIHPMLRRPVFASVHDNTLAGQNPKHKPAQDNKVSAKPNGSLAQLLLQNLQGNRKGPKMGGHDGERQAAD